MDRDDENVYRQPNESSFYGEIINRLNQKGSEAGMMPTVAPRNLQNLSINHNKLRSGSA